MIYSEEEFEVIKNNFVEYFYSEITKRKIEVGNFEIELENLIDKNLFFDKLENKLTKSETTDLIGTCLGEEWEFEGVSDSQFIWVKL